MHILKTSSLTLLHEQRLVVFKNRLLRGIIEHKGEKVSRSCKKLHNESSIIYTLHQIKL
jgi:hypothetical protein